MVGAWRSADAFLLVLISLIWPLSYLNAFVAEIKLIADVKVNRH
jgi:hypothetical protein